MPCHLSACAAVALCTGLCIQGVLCFLAGACRRAVFCRRYLGRGQTAIHLCSRGNVRAGCAAAELSQSLDSVISCQLPLSIQSGSPSVLHVLNENGVDGRRFKLWQEFNVDTFLQCYRQARQDVFGMLEVTTMKDYLMLRLRGALQEL